MVNLSITKEFTWDMAHMLANHEGLCKNVHGHTYRMQVEVERSDKSLYTKLGSTEEGMVIDFNRIKSIVVENIIEPLDHAFMYWENSTDSLELELASLLRKNGRKISGVNYKPTVEGMAGNFFEKLSVELTKYDLSLIKVIVWETPASYATAVKEG